MKITYMIYDTMTSKCWDGWHSKEQAQKEIDTWENKSDYDLHIVPTVSTDEDDAEVTIFPLWDKDEHFTTVADFTDEDMLNDDLIEADETCPIKVCDM